MTSDRDLLEENRRALQAGVDNANARGGAPPRLGTAAGSDYGDFPGVQAFPQPHVGTAPVVRPGGTAPKVALGPEIGCNGLPSDPMTAVEPLTLGDRHYRGYEIRTDSKAVDGGVQATFLIRRAGNETAPWLAAQVLPDLCDSDEAAHAAAAEQACAAIDRLDHG